MDSDEEQYEAFEIDMEDSSSDSELDIFDQPVDVSGASRVKKHDDRDMTRVPDSERTTSTYMTKYEKARIIGTRAQQLASGATATVGSEGCTDSMQLAEKELRHGKIPFVIRRKIGSDKYELWKVSELLQKNL